MDWEPLKYVCPTCKGKKIFAIGDGNDGRNCSVCRGHGFIDLVPYIEDHEHAYERTSAPCPDGVVGCTVHHTELRCTICGRKP